MPIFLVVLILFLASCPNPRSSIELSQALRLVENPPPLADDLEIGTLISGLKANINQLRKNGPVGEYNFGTRRIPKLLYVQGLEFLLREYEQSPSKSHFINLTRQHFDFYQIYGGAGNGDMKLTAYVEAEIDGSPTPSEQFTVALYAKPRDVVEVALKPFMHADFSHLAINSNLKMLGRLEHGQVLPYFSREEIDGAHKLSDKGLELCYVKPFDAFFMHIQGSGTVKFPDGTILRLGYAGQNGRRYVDYHDAWIGKVPLIHLNVRDIGNYLSTLPRAEVMKLLYLNPSYVFFRKISTRPITSMGSEVIDGRTVATDSRYFPKGALAYMIFTKYSGQKISRFVIDQDAGGAIKGPGRVDLFVGTGMHNLDFREAAGKMYYLLPNAGLMMLLSGKNF